MLFQSTPSARRATELGNAPFNETFWISIHALREEGDVFFGGFANLVIAFQSTPSARRATLLYDLLKAAFDKFQSTPSARRATRDAGRPEPVRQISIHALREEGDRRRPQPPRGLLHFNPRPPRGGRLIKLPEGETLPEFQSTPSARRATHRGRQGAPVPPISIHALREEGDGLYPVLHLATVAFQSTPSARRATTAPRS